MTLNIILTESDLRDAVALFLKTKGYDVSTVGFDVDSGDRPGDTKKIITTAYVQLEPKKTGGPDF